MLVQFSVRNFKTFKEKATLSLVASNYDKDTRETENITHIPSFNLRLTKSSVIYGANASGKTKFMEALAFMKWFAINSSSATQKGDKIDVTPFLLNSSSEVDSSEFEVIFINNKEQFRYGFEVNSKIVVAEWLFHRPKTKEVELFYRDENGIEFNERKFSKVSTLIKEDLIRPNSLLLSVTAQFNDKVAGRVLDWFSSLRNLSGLSEEHYQNFTVGESLSKEKKSKILELLKAADLGISDFKPQKFDPSQLPPNVSKEVMDDIMDTINKDKTSQYYTDINIYHRKYDSNFEHIGNEKFSLETDESSGTRKFFFLTGPILDCLENGRILIADELDSKLHPNLVKEIVGLFNSKEFNKNNAQLIFNTHDTNLLSSGLFRRDQIWFIKKDRYGAAKINSLAEFKSDEVRKNENFEEKYLEGKYGAVPYLNGFDKIVNVESSLDYENEK